MSIINMNLAMILSIVIGTLAIIAAFLSPVLERYLEKGMRRSLESLSLGTKQREKYEAQCDELQSKLPKENK